MTKEFKYIAINGNNQVHCLIDLDGYPIVPNDIKYKMSIIPFPHIHSPKVGIMVVRNVIQNSCIEITGTIQKCKKCCHGSSLQLHL